MSYIMLDESGDLGFSFEKGSSRHFLITIIFSDSKRRLEKIAKKVHGSLRKQHKRVGVLHAYHEKPVTRRRLLSALKDTDSKILVIVLDKNKVYTKLRDEKIVLYNVIANILLDRLFAKKPLSTDGEITLIASQRETNRFLNQNFKDDLTTQLRDTHQKTIRVEIGIPSKEKSLQVVDFVSWAVFRKYEYGDDTYYDIIKSLIIQESLLFP
ncbi:DUF3800 domain-containing protein [Candidatus Uhrbacteria bacterium]|nr:DUF3800 domain-containing protein [Candidatus Uhrbacteria bacterium]